MLIAVATRPPVRATPSTPVRGVTSGVARDSAAVVLARYATTLAKVREPNIVVFDYAAEQLGLHNLVQTHRIYRSGRRERDETRIVDGYTLSPPTIRTVAFGKNRYAVENLAPNPATNHLTYVGMTYRAGRRQYLFNVVQLSAKSTAAVPSATSSAAPSASKATIRQPVVATPLVQPVAAASPAQPVAAAFAVDRVEIDAVAYLPTIVRFSVRTEKARGAGEIAFGRAGNYWLVRRAEASITLAGGTPARERILFTSYSFPMQLPDTTFETPSAAIPPGGPTLPTPLPIVFPIPKR